VRAWGPVRCGSSLGASKLHPTPPQRAGIRPTRRHWREAAGVAVGAGVGQHCDHECNSPAAGRAGQGSAGRAGRVIGQGKYGGQGKEGGQSRAGVQGRWTGRVWGAALTGQKQAASMPGRIST
jgi:hypothetical protein